MSKLFVISLGGSLINGGKIDTVFLNDFKKLVVERIAMKDKFILVCGGGIVARQYQEGLSKITKASSEDLDWMGIYSTRINAQLVRLAFGKVAHPVVVEDPTIQYNFKEKILIAAGWKPGWSTDFDAVTLAKTYCADLVINLSNIDYVHTEDPKKYPDAKKIEAITWKGFRKMVGNTWNPGANHPFDPIAAKLAEKNNMKVIVANGKNLSNLKCIFTGHPFQGTEIG